MVLKSISDSSDPFSGIDLHYTLRADRNNKFREEKLSRIARSCQYILDIGRGARRDQEKFAHSNYFVLSMDPNDSPDLTADLCNMETVHEEESMDAVLCIAVLEHVYDPFAAVRQIHRVLKPGGKFFGYVPFLYPYHPKKGAYRDYFRYTEQGVAYLLKDFDDTEIASVRGNVTTIINLLPGSFSKLQRFFAPLDRFFSNRQVSGFNFYAVKRMS